MVTRIVLACVVGIATALVILLIGLVLVAIKVPIATTVGGFLETWCWVFGLLAAIWFFFTGRTTLGL
jgi:hypothetical protein